jgi:hypothetical protein
MSYFRRKRIMDEKNELGILRETSGLQKGYVKDDVDKYTNQDGSETTECHTSFTLTETNFHKLSTDLSICEGKNTSLCEKCRFRKKEER